MGICRDARKFRDDFIDAYLSGDVPSLAFHSTPEVNLQGVLRTGVKWFPKQYRMIRPEMGAHFERVREKGRRRPKREDLEKDFNNLAIGGYSYKEELFEWQFRPAVCLLAEDIPRERESPVEYPTSIYVHRYIPVLPGMENQVHTLVPRNLVLGGAEIEREEFLRILEKANRRFGLSGRLFYDYQRGKIGLGKALGLWRKREEYIENLSNTLLMYKLRKHLTKIQ